MTRLLALAMLLLLAAGVAQAAPYPERPIRLVVPFAPGGSTDVVARLLAQELSIQLGQSVVVDNRAGGGTNIGVDFVARAAPDGYVLLMASTTQAINVSLYRRLSYDLIKDFTPISPVATSPSMLVVHPSVPATSLATLLALARDKPGALTYASSGNGSTAHLAGEMLKSAAGVDIIHVPYKGAGPAMADVLGGQVNMMFGFTAGVLPYTRAGQLRALAVTSLTRLADLPELPTMTEAGLPGYEVAVWYGVMAPAGLPPEIVSRLHDETAIATRRLEARLLDLGAYTLFASPTEFGRFVDDEIKKWSPVVANAHAQVD